MYITPGFPLAASLLIESALETVSNASKCLYILFLSKDENYNQSNIRMNHSLESSISHGKHKMEKLREATRHFDHFT
jgi:hypothetical protein